jgi:Ca-activated chloride channel homolog
MPISRSSSFTVRLMGALTCLAIFTLAAYSQSDVDTVHVVPGSLHDAATVGRTLFRSEVNLVLVNVTVLDHSQKPVTGLTRNDFLLTEDRALQSIKYFSQEDQPISLTIVVDASGSMAARIEQVRKAAATLARTSNPLDEISVIVVHDKPIVAFRLGDPTDSLPAGVENIFAEGQTALWDAMTLAVQQLKKAHYDRRAMVVISDGGDNHSIYTESELKSLLEEADIQVYAVGLFDRFPRRNEERRGPRDLEELTSVTGGRLLAVTDELELRQAVDQVNLELRSQYLLGYSSSNQTHDGRWRKLTVTMKLCQGHRKLHAFTKKGYYVASE